MRRALVLSSLILVLCYRTCIAQAAPDDQSVPKIVASSSDSVVLLVIADSSGKETTLGSGFIISQDGMIATNFHVIQGGYSAVAKLANGAFFPVDGVLGVDLDSDLAVLKVPGKNLPYLRLSESEALVGEHVIAIGSPLGLQNTISDGIVSGMTQVAPGRKLIQTTAPISHGNSGGPLLNNQGSVIGVIRATISEGQNLNFAVPVSQLKSLLLHSDQLRPLAVASNKPRPASVESRSTNQPLKTSREALASARSIFVWVRSGSPVLESEISNKLVSWGQLDVRTSPGEADLVLEVVQTGELNTMTGAGNQATGILKDYHSGLQLWSTTKGGSWAMSGWSNAWVGKAIANDLIKFLKSAKRAQDNK